MSTLKVDNILKKTGTGTITLGQSGDTLAIPSGVTIANSGTATGFAGSTNYWNASRSSNQSISSDTETTVLWNTVNQDNNSGYATGTGKYTVPSGQAGYYMIGGGCRYADDPSGHKARFWIKATVSSSSVDIGYSEYNTSGTYETNMTMGTILLGVGDQVYCTTQHNEGGSLNFVAGWGSRWGFFGFKIN